MVSYRLLGWLAAVLAMLTALALVLAEVTDAAQRRWRATHPLTTDTVAGLLVLLVSPGRESAARAAAGRQRGHAVAAQAAIMVDDALYQLQDAAAPLLQLLSPRVREFMQGIGQTAEE